jgi:peptidylprolyl isomerase
MSQAKDKDTVKVHYTGKLEDGSVFDSSTGREPLEFTLGTGSVIPGFDQGIVGMAIGETKTITITPDDAYGPLRKDLVIEVKKSDIPGEIDTSVGQRLQIPQPEGQPIPVVITEVTDETITLDANHPLAGKTLIFDVELVEIG